MTSAKATVDSSKDGPVALVSRESLNLVDRNHCNLLLTKGDVPKSYSQHHVLYDMLAEPIRARRGGQADALLGVRQSRVRYLSRSFGSRITAR